MPIDVSHTAELGDRLLTVQAEGTAGAGGRVRSHLVAAQPQQPAVVRVDLQGELLALAAQLARLEARVMALETRPGWWARARSTVAGWWITLQQRLRRRT